MVTSRWIQTTLWISYICTSASLTNGYKVEVVDRMLTGKPLVQNASAEQPYSKSACGGKICTNVLNPAWISYTGSKMSDSGALFIRLATPTSSPSVICMLPAVPGTEGLRFEAPADKCVLKDGPKGTKEEVAIAIDPRAIYRPMTDEYFVFYQTLWNGTRRTQISATKTPSVLSSWKRFKNTMFNTNDCGTTLWFPEDEDDTIKEKKAFAIATLFSRLI